MPDLTRDYFAELQEVMRSMRFPDETYVLVGFGVHGPGADCPTNGSVSVTILKGDVKETSEAVHLHDAILLARAKVNHTIERIRWEREEAKSLKAVKP